MRILVIHNQYLHKGGEDTVVAAEINLLERFNHDVQLLLFQNEEISSFKTKILIGIFAAYNPASANILEAKIVNFIPDIIHVHNFFPIASPSIFFTASKFNIPTIMTVHNYRLICPNALLYKNGGVCEKCIHKAFPMDDIMQGCYRESKIQTFALATMSFFHHINKTWHRKVDKFITLTYFEKNKFLSSSFGAEEEQYIIKPNFVEDYGFETAKEEFCLYVGRLSEEKGLEVLIKAFEKTERILYVIGTGPLESTIKKAVKINKNIHYLGYQNKDAVISAMKRAKAVIVPSLCYETFGMTIVEAFSVGTPVICSDIGAMAEIVQDHTNGLHFQRGNFKDLKEKIDWLYNHKSEHESFCAEARKEFELKYTADKNYKMLIDIYEGAIVGKKKDY